jgi:hypothetical protein
MRGRKSTAEPDRFAQLGQHLVRLDAVDAVTSETNQTSRVNLRGGQTLLVSLPYPEVLTLLEIT